MPVWLGWMLCVVVVAGYARRDAPPHRRTRRKPGLPREPMSRAGPPRSLALAVVLGVPTSYLSQERSRNPRDHLDQGRARCVVPIVARAAGRADVPARPHRAAAGTSTPSAATPRPPAGPASTCPASGCSASSSARRWPRSAGILLASRDNSVSPTTGGARRPCCTPSARPSSAAPACSAARAGCVDAIIGGLVIAVIDNGMGLLNQTAGRYVYMVTGLVLLLAASVDAISPRRLPRPGEC